MLGGQFREDAEVVTNQALVYAKSLNLGNDSKDLWVFEVDDTSLTNLPYFAQNGFGAEPRNFTTFNDWILEGRAPALQESLKLYNNLLERGIKVAFITGRLQDKTQITASNLQNAGFHTWEKLILKERSYLFKSAVVYKSDKRKELEDSGYRIVGNIGDQWSDLLGTNVGNRTFKFPDPLYYVG